MTQLIWKITYTIRDEKGKTSRVTINTATEYGDGVVRVIDLAEGFGMALDGVIGGSITSVNISHALVLRDILNLKRMPLRDSDVEQKYKIQMQSENLTAGKRYRKTFSFPTFRHELSDLFGGERQLYDDLPEVEDFYEQLLHADNYQLRPALTDARGLRLNKILRERAHYERLHYNGLHFKGR
jgi:predicted RNA-binding protein with TRAM domain